MKHALSALLALAILLSARQADTATPVLIGLEPFPCDCDSNGSFSDAEFRSAQELAIASGADFLSLSQDWDELESSLGSYSLTGIERLLDEANSGNVWVQLTVVVISFDGTSKVPSFLSGLDFDHADVTSAMNGLIDEIYGLSGSSRLKILLLGNEIEDYLEENASQITPFANLLTSAKNRVRGKAGWETAHVTASIKHADAADYTTTYAAIQTADTIAAFTYYPINGDFTVQHTNAETMADDVFDDLNAIYSATGGAQMLISESGYPSATSLNGSEVLQSAFVQVLSAQAQVIGESLLYSVDIQWMTDWPDWLLDDRGYTGAIRDFVGSVGYRYNTSIEKVSWPGLKSALHDGYSQRRRMRGN